MGKSTKPRGTLSKHSNTQPRYALLSVFDKTGIADLARVLQKVGYVIVSSGGTFDVLVRDGVKNVVPIDDITKNPRDSFDGRMKTISFAVESGILFDRDNPNHVAQAKKLGVPQVDVVVCNLYPFEKTLAKPGVTEEELIEKIDVGGPTMVDAAAKNYKSVLVLVDPSYYDEVSKRLATGSITREFRKSLAGRAFNHLALYFAVVGGHYNTERFPEEIALPLRRANILRYGENLHQEGVLYITPNTNSSLAKLEVLRGRELSETNIGDIAAGIETVRLFKEPAAVIIKHHTGCGIAEASTIAKALFMALEGDPESAFGGVVVTNRPLDLDTAQAIANFKKKKNSQMDIIAAPDISAEAIDLLGQVRKTTGVYRFGDISERRTEKWDVKCFNGVAVLQDWDDALEASFKNWQVVTKNHPTDKQLEQMRFAWKAVKAVKSNAVLVVDSDIKMTRGIGTGQTSRVRATNIALEQAKDYTKNGILASDSFFPFNDSVKKAAKYKIGAIIQQGGSINDQASIDAANEAGIPMVFTYNRAFRH